MKDYMIQRVLEEANYIIENKSTVRETAKAFGIGKSTTYTDVTVLLKEINPQLQKEVAEVLEYNKDERAVRGGKVTKELWKNRLLKPAKRKNKNKTNFEKLKQELTITDMVDIIKFEVVQSHIACDCCAYSKVKGFDECKNEDCDYGIIKWLESEVK